MRKTERVTVPNVPRYARDVGKTFLITEMPASQGEAWAARAISAMARGGVDIPPEFLTGGWAVIAMVGMKAIFTASFEDAQPLLDEMMGCVQSVQTAAPDGRRLIEEDIEEIATRLWIRDEVFRVHSGFSITERLSNILTMANSLSTSDDTPNTPMLKETSEPSSQADEQPYTS